MNEYYNIFLNLFIQNFGDSVFTMTKAYFFQQYSKNWITEEQNLLLKNYLILK